MMFRKGLGLVVAVALLATAARSSADTFPAGSLIIPTDECYQLGQTNAAAWVASSNPMVRETWTSSTTCGYADSTSTATNVSGGTADCSNPAGTGADATPTSYYAQCATSSYPSYGTCYAPTGYGASSTGMQHAFGVLYLLASNHVPVSVALNPKKVALSDPDFSIEAPGSNINPAIYLRYASGAYTANE